ncbi:hypothetical protein VP01_986g6 [Puccinia sorghi]|uniref:DDE Tnp4 domain-containing protein n=1 Tax=Puccinia sorghi TaxID=27349 RepID=A0A0L6U7K5_9BASI|nr:hypothetical protein VP01_986g6 [Puccinia sorghi]
MHNFRQKKTKLFEKDNGVEVGKLATFFRIGEGPIELYTYWCMVAILELKPQLLTWPTPDAHKEIQKGFEGCMSLIDGLLQPQGSLWDCGSLPGCSHNQHLMSNSVIASKPQDFFSNGEYVLDDTAFTPTTNVVPAFKQNINCILSNEEHHFNRCGNSKGLVHTEGPQDGTTTEILIQNQIQCSKLP